MARLLGPRPSPGFKDQSANDVPSALQASVSGEITSTGRGLPLGTTQIGGTIRDVWFSLGAGGKINVNPLSMAVDVKVNGTSCVSTQPVIAASTATSAQKTTKASGTGITQRVLDYDNLSVAAGDVLTFDYILTRTASPTTEMANLVVCVEIDPD